MSLNIEGVRRDVTELSSFPRDSAGPGERRAAALLRRRFEEVGAHAAHLRSFRYSPRWTDAQGAHFAAGIAAAARGGVAGSLVAAAAGASYLADFSGRSQWTRPLLPRGEGASAVARLHPRGRRERTLVLIAHLDAAQTGLMWNPKFTGSWFRDSGTKASPSPGAVPLLAFGLIATGSRRARQVGGALLATSLALTADVARSATVPGANDNASGAAGLVALVEEFARNPLENTEVIAVTPGCEESGMGGARDFLHSARAELHPERTLVLGLDGIGAGGPHVLTGEGPPGLTSYRDEDVAFAGDLPRFHLAGWTDPILAVFMGLPTISLVGIKDGGFPNYHLPSDTVEKIEWDAVERCLDAAADIARRFDRG